MMASSGDNQASDVSELIDPSIVNSIKKIRK